MLRLEVAAPIFSFDIGIFTVNINRDIIVQWGVIVILGLVSYILTRNLKLVPNKKQVVLESIYTYVEDLVINNIGERFASFIPYVGTLVIYLLCLNLTGLIGIAPPTANLSVTLGLGLTSFFVINFTAMRLNGPIGYAKGLGQPYLLMLPINLMERIILPISLALRLFGNMLAATMLIDMMYKALGSISVIAELGLPIIAHGYFDLFDGTIQMLVFTMLTIINIKMTAEHH